MAKQNIFAKRAGHRSQQIARRANHPTEPFDPRRPLKPSWGIAFANVAATPMAATKQWMTRRQVRD